MNRLSSGLVAIAKNPRTLAQIYPRVASKGFASDNRPFDDVPQFKSTYSLDKVYPKSTLNPVAVPKIPQNEEEFTGYIPSDKLKISYCRSSGPGGQHVNKTNSKVTVCVHLASAEWIPSKARPKLAKLHKNSINKEGFWMITSEKTRTATLNLADCMDKMRCYITEASRPVPVPDIETVEMWRERAEKAAAARLRQKRIHSNRVRSKQAPTVHDI
jgi:peptidyl-tRNA hydrolase ICT1